MKSILLAAAILSCALAPGPALSSSGHAHVKASPATFEVYKDKGGKFRWRLKAANGQVIATSGEGYSDKRGCMAGIDSVKRNASTAQVTEKP